MPVVGKELVRTFPPESVAARRHLHLQRPLGLQRPDRGYFHLHTRLPPRSGHRLLGEQRPSRRYRRPQGLGPQRGGVRGRADYPADAPAPGGRAERGPAGHPHAQRPLQREGDGRHPRPGGRRLGGAEALVRIARDHGLEDLRAVADEIIARSEQSMRAGIRALPNGTFVKSMQVEIGGTDEPAENPALAHHRRRHDRCRFRAAPAPRFDAPSIRR